MAIDRGGLEYTIEVRDRFLAETQLFQREVKAMREDLATFEAQFRSFQRASRGFGNSFRSLPDQARRARQEFEQTGRAQERVNRSAAISADERRRRFQALQVQTRQGQAQFRAEEQALRRIVSAEQQLAAAQRLRNRNRTSSGLTQQEAVQQQALLRIEREKIRLQSQQISDQDTELQKLRQEAGIRQAIERRNTSLQRQAAVLANEEIRKLEEKNTLLRDERGIRQRILRLEDPRIRSLQRELEVKRRIAAADERAAVASQLAAQGRDAQGRRTRSAQDIAQARVGDRIRQLEQELEFRSAARGNQRLRELEAQIGRVDGQANRLSFTFRRLFGILAAFAAARFAISGFGELVRDSIRFNANIEQAQLGIASLFVAVGSVANATGEAATSAQGLALAQQEARRQTALLRADAQKTAASFDQLLETFQVAVAPGLTAGLDVDQIRRLTVQISQAAAAIGLPQNQLAEEIRSLLEGTIQARTTRIATALGITNEDIKLAKEAGDLAEFLNDRFQAFSTAGEEALGTFNALLTNTVDAIRQVIGAGGLEFFNEIKGLLSDVLNSLQTQTDDGLLEPNPRAVDFVRQIFSFLQAAVQEARNLVDSLSFSDVQNFARTTAGLLIGVVRIVGGLVQGLVQGLGDLGNAINLGIVVPLRSVLGIFGTQFDDAGRSVREVVAFTTRWLTLLFGIRTVLGIIASTKVAIVAASTTLRTLAAARLVTMRSLLTATRGVAVATLATLAPIGLIVGGIVAAGAAIKLWLDDLFGIELKFTSLVTIVSVNVVGALRILASKTEFFFTTAFSSIRQVMIQVSDFINDNILAAFEGVLRAADGLLGIGSNLLRDVQASRRLAAQGSEQALAAERERLEVLQAQIKAEEDRIRAGVVDDTTDVLNNNENAESFVEVLKRKVEEGLGALDFGNIFGDTDLGLSESVDEAQTLSDIFSDLPAQISGASRVLIRQQDDVRKLREEIEETGAALNVSSSTLGATGAVQQQARIISDAQVRAARQTREVVQAQVALEQRIAAIRGRALNFSRQVVSLRETERGIVQEGVALGLRVAQTENQIAQTVQRIETQRLLAQRAQEAGNEEAAASAQERLNQERQLEARLQENLRLQRETANALTEGLGQEDRSRVLDLVRQGLILQGEEATLQRELAEVVDFRKGLEEQLNQITSNRLTAIAQQETVELQRQTAELQAQVDAQSRLAIARAGGGVLGGPSEFGIRLAEAENALRIEQTRARLISEENQAQLEALETQLAQTQNLEARLALEEQLAELRERNRLADEESNALLDQRREKFEALQEVAESPVQFGLAAAFTQFTELIENKFQTTLMVMQSALEQFANLASELIVAAFDPNEQGTTRERFQRFFQGLFTLFVNFLTRLAIAYLAVTLIPGLREFITLLGASGAGGSGGAEGGQIPGGAQASPSHYGPGVKGYSGGGDIKGDGKKRKPPKGVDKRDTTPIWAQPGEWMMRLKAVRMYGNQVMAAINDGRLDPGVLRGLAAQTNVSRVVRSSKGPGFITGGRIGSAALRASGNSSGGSLMPVLPVNDRVIDQMTNGGRAAFIDFFNEEDDAIRNNPRGNPGA